MVRHLGNRIRSQHFCPRGLPDPQQMARFMHFALDALQRQYLENLARPLFVARFAPVNCFEERQLGWVTERGTRLRGDLGGLGETVDAG
ncbi:MAG: hypothetical protein M3428_03645, partial [Pseudomonadota bacterium]|nr:hypothetical protein [Pseudomonadota bacterium]